MPEPTHGQVMQAKQRQLTQQLQGSIVDMLKELRQHGELAEQAPAIDLMNSVAITAEEESAILERLRQLS